MKTSRTKSLLLMILFMSICSYGQDVKNSGGVLPQGSKFLMTKSVMGTKGAEQGGRFIMEDPRTTFYIPQDKQVIAYFEWEGAPGVHTIEASWLRPGGKIGSTDEFKYDAKERRFAGYFTLLVPEAIDTGVWQIETRVDGESSGTVSFQIVAATRPDNLMLQKRLLEMNDIYKHATLATVTIEKLDASGNVFDHATGFVIDSGELVTTFQSIDSATSLRAVNSDGAKQEITEILDYDRLQDWAVLKTPNLPIAKLPTANDAKVGDRCFSLQTADDGTRTIVSGVVTGNKESNTSGPRILCDFQLGYYSAGSPLLNEYGEVFAVLGGIVLPGFRTLQSKGTSWHIPTNLTYLPTLQPSLQGIPLTTLSRNLKKPSTVQQLIDSGQFTPQLNWNENVISGSIGVNQGKSTRIPLGVNNSKYEFSSADKSIQVNLDWMPHSKVKGTANIVIYDVNNSKIAEGKPSKLNISPPDPVQSNWMIDPTPLPAGTYRVDVLLDAIPIWRSYFKIVK